MDIRELRASDCKWTAAVLGEHFGSPRVVSRGRLHDAEQLPGFVARSDGQPAGLVVYRIDGAECEVVALVVERPRRGIGRALTEAVVARARSEGCSRVWLVTTNDNVTAQCFYQALGWRLAGVHVGAVTESRVLKPEIPALGMGGVPIEDEIEFDLTLVDA